MTTLPLRTEHRQEGYCGDCHHWFRIWRSQDAEHEAECPVCRTPALMVLTRGERSAV